MITFREPLISYSVFYFLNFIIKLRRILVIFLGLLYLAIQINCNYKNPKNAEVPLAICYDTLFPVIYNCVAASNGDYAFRTIPSKKLQVKLIPNLETRTKLQLTKIDNIMGVHQFFLDHDLVSGFVHPFTKNMYDKLKPEEFVLKFIQSKTDKNIGTISYVHKSELSYNDKLGKNIAYFRNWRLSEIDYKISQGKVYLKSEPCNFNKRCSCPESSKTGNLKQIPVWHQAKSGNTSITKFNAFGAYDGGTVAIIWEVNGEIFFQDIHSSWQEILERAIEISKKYNIDPTIAISDAGPLANKVRADKNFELSVAKLNALAPHGNRFGAGYGYVQTKHK
jgi:hypothetical protein